MAEIHRQTAADLVRVAFVALETYGLHGGIQRFNRRVIQNLGALIDAGALASAHVVLKGEGPHAGGGASNVAVAACGADRARVIAETLRASKNADVLLVGHVNLLPVASLAKAMRPGLRLILFAHGDDVWNDALRPKRVYEPILLRLVDRVAVVSRYTARVMAREFGVPEGKFTIFPNVVDDIPPVAAPPRDTNQILCVTRMGAGDRRKHVDQLIRAVGLLACDGLPVRLTIIGGGSLLDELKTLVRALKLDEQVAFLEQVSDAELRESYARAGVFALPSSKEGFGIVYLEAWQYGLPVICGSTGAPKEIVADGIDGLVADEQSVDDLAAKLRTLVVNPSMASAMGARGRAKVAELYSGAVARRNLAALLGAPEQRRR